MSGMTSSRPYLVRAFHEWIIDNNMTPYIVVNATIPGAKIPQQYVEDGRIILNIALTATDRLTIDNSRIEFQASFGGKIQTVLAPIAAVEAIYAKETGKGMIFSDEDDEGTPPPVDPPSDSESKFKDKGSKKGSHLRVVK